MIDDQKCHLACTGWLPQFWKSPDYSLMLQPNVLVFSSSGAEDVTLFLHEY